MYDFTHTQQHGCAQSHTAMMRTAALLTAVGCLAALATGQDLAELEKTLELKKQTQANLAKKCTGGFGVPARITTHINAGKLEWPKNSQPVFQCW